MDLFEMRKSVIKLFILVFIGVTFINKTSGQDKAKVKALNTYIQFLNESVHGLFTAHALMVISNKEVNRYIDLDSYILNNISNDEVQSNLFAKSDKENYTTFHTYSPLELHVLAKERSVALNNGLAKKLNAQADDIVAVLNKINRIRVDIATFIESHDLNEKESIYGVFEILENGVQLFGDYAKAHAKMANEIKKNSPEPQDELLKKAEPLHSFTQTILRNLREENDTYFENNFSGLQSSFALFEEQVKAYGLLNSSSYKSNVKIKVDKVINLLKSYLSPGTVPVEHELYGKHYYYHNELAKRYFNWSGPGFVRNLNKLLTDANIDFVNFVEEPLIFKVVYPMKLDELNDIEKKEAFIKERKPNVIGGNALKLTSPKERNEGNYVVIEVHDFNMYDRDSISVKYNDEWIFEDYMLKPEPKKFKIDFESDDDINTIAFRAENLGIRAPNTFAVSYRFNGQRKKHRREYNLQEGQVIEVDLNTFIK